MSSGGCYVLSGLFEAGASTSKIGSYSHNRYFSGSWPLHITCHPVGPFHIACISYSMVVSDNHISYMVSGTQETGERSCLTSQGLHPRTMQHQFHCICMPRFSHSTQSTPGGREINVTSWLGIRKVMFQEKFVVLQIILLPSLWQCSLPVSSLATKPTSHVPAKYTLPVPVNFIQLWHRGHIDLD